MPRNNTNNKNGERKGIKNKQEQNRKNAASVDHNGPSKIPVYNNSNRRQFNMSNGNQSNGLSACLSDNMPDLPEHIKMLHNLHNHSNHASEQGCIHRSATQDFYSVQSSSSFASTPGNSTPREFNRRNSHTSFAQSSTMSQSSNKNKKNKYEEYLPLCEIQKGLKKGEIVEGILRINPKKYNDAYISAPDGGLDIFVNGLISRNRALNNDNVFIKLNVTESWMISYSAINSNWPKWQDEFNRLGESCNANKGKGDSELYVKLENLKLNTQDVKKLNLNIIANKNANGNDSTSENMQDCNLKSYLENEFPNLPYQLFWFTISDLLKIDFWPEFIQRTGKVVYIKEMSHSRIVAGHVRLNDDKQNNQYAHFISNDSRIPHVIIPVKSIPKDFIINYNLLKDNLFLVKIIDWKSSSYYPHGEIMKSLGKSGNVESEIEILLTGYEIDTSEFPDEALAEYQEYFSGEKSWSIPEKEYSYRRDFRSECVFTIDPQSARDLDDAISYKELPGNLFEIGVHIADVSYFIKESTLLDEIAQHRATSVYLVNRVIPMLPSLFCQNLCSLTAGEDKLTVSVVFVVDDDGNVKDKWFGRTVINSCAKFSYEHAQKLIDSKGSDFNLDEFPTIFGDWPMQDICYRTKRLYQIAQKIRDRRFATGSLRLEKSKLSFILDDEGMPICFSKYDYKDSNRLIEELMLLANKSVAERIFNCFGSESRAFLRSHPSPSLYNLNEFTSFCKNLSINFDVSSSLNIYNSLQSMSNENPVYFRLCSMNLIKSMKLAKYTCVSESDPVKKYHHYALNFDHYTHFTSPIRRYADVIVHRLLAASLDYNTGCSQDSVQLLKIANNCNTRKYNAYMVSEHSSEVYLKAYISHAKALQTKAIVCNVYDHSFDVLILELDIMNRVYLDHLPIESFEFVKLKGSPELKLNWMPVDNCGESLNLKQTISNLTELEVEITITDQFKYNVIIAHPNGEFIDVSKTNQ